MNISVRSGRYNPDSGEGIEDIYEGAKGWVIDTDGRLHITKESGGNAASYDRGSWGSVIEAPAPKPAAGTHDGPFGIRTPDGYAGHNPASAPTGRVDGVHLHFDGGDNSPTPAGLRVAKAAKMMNRNQQ